jgi:hypothetical protein
LQAVWRGHVSRRAHADAAWLREADRLQPWAALAIQAQCLRVRRPGRAC